ncbi:hypothetical protein N825_18455 [Skermanella stibiiresistens SB22]|uniref:Uncharacterized protein n=1 Tax=Skermanella stibiiresistens SB22 TaxID=1385369 RepID=W9H7U3_9PROT|nr:hypothetical protein N825_18455 [Skermanella stibiiresistens SB22]
MLTYWSIYAAFKHMGVSERRQYRIAAMLPVNGVSRRIRLLSAGSSSGHHRRAFMSLGHKITRDFTSDHHGTFTYIPAMPEVVATQAFHASP